MSMLGSDPADVLSLDPANVAQWWHEACAQQPGDAQVVVGRRAKLSWEQLPEAHIRILEGAADTVLRRLCSHLQKVAMVRLHEQGAYNPPYVEDPTSNAQDHAHAQAQAHAQAHKIVDPDPHPATSPRGRGWGFKGSPLMPTLIAILLAAAVTFVLLMVFNIVAEAFALAVLTVIAIVFAIVALASRR